VAKLAGRGRARVERSDRLDRLPHCVQDRMELAAVTFGYDL